MNKKVWKEEVTKEKLRVKFYIEFHIKYQIIRVMKLWIKNLHKYMMQN